MQRGPAAPECLAVPGGGTVLGVCAQQKPLPQNVYTGVCVYTTHMVCECIDLLNSKSLFISA